MSKKGKKGKKSKDKFGVSSKSLDETMTKAQRKLFNSNKAKSDADQRAMEQWAQQGFSSGGV